jgi:two-component system cell cycle sensor histidine kinase/response regulator CckA
VQKMEAIGQLTGGVAHDFNNLLTVINCYAQLTLDALGPDSPIRPDVVEIQQAGERAAMLTRQLLAFSRKQVLEPRVLDLNTLVTDIETMLRRVITEDIKLRVVLEPDLGCVRADPTQMEQVIMNLVVNARDAMPEGGTVKITTANVELDAPATDDEVRGPQPFVMLAVTDTGTGMDDETKRRLFEPFFTTKEVGKGTGLGLATVYGIVQQSNGSIAVSTAVGKGATFTIHLPRVDQSADAAPTDEQPATTLQGTETVLLVEDDSPLRTLAQTILRSNGYRVLTAANRDEALAFCRSFGGEIHLMVTDVVMPGMRGSEFSGVLADIRPQMRTLYMSGYTDDTITRRGVLIEGVSFLQKPFTAQNLLRKVKQVLAR